MWCINSNLYNIVLIFSPADVLSFSLSLSFSSHKGSEFIERFPDIDLCGYSRAAESSEKHSSPAGEEWTNV